MNYEWFVARRYLTAKRKQAFISVITSISILGIAIGVMALVIAIALITGFQNDVQDKILSSTSHLMITDFGGNGIEDYQQVMDELVKIPGVESASPIIYDMALISGPFKNFAAILRGMDFDREKVHSPWLQELEGGQLPQADAVREEMILGNQLAFNIGASVGDVITVYTAAARLTPLGPRPRSRRFKVTGIFSTGLYEFDSSAALINLTDSQRVFNLPDRVNMIQIRIDNIFHAQEIKERIRPLLQPETYSTTWMEMNRPLFSALKLEKKLMFITITLIVLVAALNIIATLILMVMEKTRDIGILIAMGTTAKGIRKIFFFQGAMIGIFGTFFGTLLGLAWCWLANTFQLIKVPADVYQIPFVPFRIQFLDLLMIIGVALLISFLSTLFPSYRAAKVDPAKALKYE